MWNEEFSRWMFISILMIASVSICTAGIPTSCKLTALIIHIYYYPIVFAEYPMNVTLTYPSETVATFRCRLESGDDADWLINGSNPRHFFDLNPSMNLAMDNGTIVDLLSITVTPEHNDTQVACVATVDGASVASPNATLIIIIGLLHPVCPII